jgi:hypothetical protein
MSYYALCKYERRTEIDIHGMFKDVERDLSVAHSFSDWDNRIYEYDHSLNIGNSLAKAGVRDQNLDASVMRAPDFLGQLLCLFYTPHVRSMKGDHRRLGIRIRFCICICQIVPQYLDSLLVGVVRER